MRPASTFWRNADGHEINVRPTTDQKAGIGFYDPETTRFVIPTRDIAAGEFAAARDDGFVRCEKVNPADAFSVGDKLSFSGEGVIAGTDPLTVVRPSPSGDQYLFAELNQPSDGSAATGTPADSRKVDSDSLAVAANMTIDFDTATYDHKDIVVSTNATVNFIKSKGLKTGHRVVIRSDSATPQVVTLTGVTGLTTLVATDVAEVFVLHYDGTTLHNSTPTNRTFRTPELATTASIWSGQEVSILDRLATQSGGGSTFWFDATSTLPIDGGFVLDGPGGSNTPTDTAVLAPGTGIGRLIEKDQSTADLDKFGCVGDDTADDHLRFQAALDTGKRVVGGSGKIYNIEGTVTLPNPFHIDLPSSKIHNRGTEDSFLITTATNSKFVVDELRHFVGSGHVWVLTELLAQSTFRANLVRQLSTAKSIFHAADPTSGVFFTRFTGEEYGIAFNHQVPAFDVSADGNACSSNVFDFLRADKSGNAPFFRLACRSTSTYFYGNVISNVGTEVCNGGVVYAAGNFGLTIRSMQHYDNHVASVVDGVIIGHMIELTSEGGGRQTVNTVLDGVTRNNGSLGTRLDVSAQGAIAVGDTITFSGQTAEVHQVDPGSMIVVLNGNAPSNGDVVDNGSGATATVDSVERFCDVKITNARYTTFRNVHGVGATTEALIDLGNEFCTLMTSSRYVHYENELAPRVNRLDSVGLQSRLLAIAENHGTHPISAGTIDVTGDSHMRVDTEGSAAIDELDTINGGRDGQVLILRAASASRTVLVGSVGNINVPQIRSLDSTNVQLTLIWDYVLNKWNELAFSGAELNRKEGQDTLPAGSGFVVNLDEGNFDNKIAVWTGSGILNLSPPTRVGEYLLFLASDVNGTRRSITLNTNGVSLSDDSAFPTFVDSTELLSVRCIFTGAKWRFEPVIGQVRTIDGANLLTDVDYDTVADTWTPDSGNGIYVQWKITGTIPQDAGSNITINPPLNIYPASEVAIDIAEPQPNSPTVGSWSAKTGDPTYAARTLMKTVESAGDKLLLVSDLS